MSKIVIVEDDRVISSMYKLKLENLGFQVSTAFDGKEGLDVIKKAKPDLILLDLKMPEMTGEEMLGKLRKTEFGATVRVVILTNISKDEAPASLRLLNIDRYIVKAHYTPTEVAKVVSEILASSQEQ